MSSSPALASTDALLIVDVQNDFCPGGALPIAQGDAVVPVINPWIEKARDLGILLLFSRDFHPHNHPSFHAYGGQWPERLSFNVFHSLANKRSASCPGPDCLLLNIHMPPCLRISTN